MRVVLTGAAGYLGRVARPALEAGGHEVLAWDLGWFAAERFGDDPLPPFERVDVRDAHPRHLAGVDAVVHFAALSNDPLGDIDPALTYAINRDASVRLARAAREAGVRRFVYASSCSVYGAATADDLLDETAPLHPVTAYARSKIAVEEALSDLAGPAFAPTSLRNATAYGVSPALRCDLVVNDLVARALLHGVVEVLSDGTPWRPVVHAEDIAGACLAVLAAPEDDVRDQAFNVGNPVDNHRIGDLAALVAAAVPGARVVVTGQTGPDTRSYRVDFTKAARVLGFTPRWTVQRGIAQLRDAYRRHGLTESDFTSRFRRLPALLDLRRSGRLEPDLRWHVEGGGCADLTA